MPEENNIDTASWARTTVVDQAAIDHESDFGALPASGEKIRIRAAQRVDFDLLATPVTMRVHPPRLHVGDVEFSVPQARAAHEALGRAISFAEQFEEDPPTPDEP